MSPTEADRESRTASIVLALALPGDAVLYLLLPLYAASFGVTLPEAGLLLAANRLVRIAGYGWVGRFYEARGPGASCRLAAAAAAASTFAYALCSGVWLLLVARLVWGLAFAAMNISVQALATAEPSGAARRNGASRSVIAMGPLLGLLGAALGAELIGPRAVFAVLGVAAVFAVPMARQLGASGAGRVEVRRPRVSMPSSLDVWSFVQGFTLDGLFVIGLAVLAAAAMGEHAALAAGSALALRYAGELMLGRAGGVAAARWGGERMLILFSVMAAIALALTGLGWLWSGAVAVVILRSLLQPLAPPVAAERNPGAERVPALARLAIWRDLGAGLGPLLTGWLLAVLSGETVYVAGAFALALAALAVGIPSRTPPGGRNG